MHSHLMESEYYKTLAYLCARIMYLASFYILETNKLSYIKIIPTNLSETHSSTKTHPYAARAWNIPDTHAELNVNVWTICASTERRQLFAIHLLLSFCIVLAHISMDCVYCLDVHQCNVLHYSCDSEVVHLKHQKNDKQPWFREMHVRAAPPSRAAIFCASQYLRVITLGKDTYKKKHKWLGLPLKTKCRSDPLLCHVAHSGPCSSILL